MAVTITWTVPVQGLDDEAAVSSVEAALTHGGRPGVGIAVVFVDDPTLTDLHARYLDDPTPTDVIAFDLGDDGGVCGELYVSVDRARAVAERRGVSLSRELALYLVHGTLHLCGYDDHEEHDRQAMRAAEAELLRGLGFPDDPRPHDEAQT